MNFNYCERPRYERTLLALLASLGDGGMLLRNGAVYQSTPKTRENTHKNQPLRQHRSLNSSLTQMHSRYITMQYKNLQLQLCILQYKLLRLYVYFDFKIPIPISRFEFSYPK